MELKPIGAIFWRLDANGNLTAYDTSGNVLAKFVGGLFSGAINAFEASVSADATTTSTTFVSSGAGIANMTLQVSGLYFLTGSAYIGSSVSGDTVEAAIYKKTGAGAVPAAGTAVGADNQLALTGTIPVAAIARIPFQLFGSETVGTPFTPYLAFRRNTGTGTITIHGGPAVSDKSRFQIMEM